MIFKFKGFQLIKENQIRGLSRAVRTILTSIRLMKKIVFRYITPTVLHYCTVLRKRYNPDKQPPSHRAPNLVENTKENVLSTNAILLSRFLKNIKMITIVEGDGCFT